MPWRVQLNKKYWLLFVYTILLNVCLFANGTDETKDPRIQEILEFWFGPLNNPEEYPESKSEQWFKVDKAFDAEIRSRFGDLVISASKKELEAWKTPKGRLALIILLDQFPRNIYRNTPQAFAYDCMAQELTLEGLAVKDDKKLFPIERVFFYLPLEHAENLALQELSVEKIKDLVSNLPEKQKSPYQSYLDYAVQHYQIIAKFGRFPHRNKILDRMSTPEEIEFLTQPQSSF